MDLEITPEPTEEERQAIVEALRLEAAAERETSRWHRPTLEPEPSQTFADAPAKRVPMYPHESVGFRAD